MLRLSLFFIALFIVLTGTGGKVDVTTARKVASNWYRHYAPPVKKHAAITKSAPYRYKGRDCFYIFSFDKGGFVLVAANDAIHPVLGYGFDFSIPDSIANEAVRVWFDGYARQIDTAFVLSLGSNEVSAKWHEALMNNFPMLPGDTVGPLITTTWDQGCYYNEMCPEDISGPCNHAWAGCVATAVAQVMKYHAYPPAGIGYREYFSSKYGYLSTIFSHPIRFDSMPNTLAGPNSYLSELLFDIGVSATTQYNPGSSGAYFTDAAYGLTHYFDYDSTSINYVHSVFYSPLEWNNLIKSELDNNRPVLYEGTGGAGTHALVCDGYSGDYFHMNYGWSGYYNGYYMLEALPMFNANNYALIGIKPQYSGLSADFSRVDKIDSILTTQFIDFSRGNPDHWLWDFGDGDSSELQNPVHQFSTSAKYPVTLISGNSASTDTVLKFVYVPPSFTNIKSTTCIMDQGDLDFGDIDNDGDMDLLASGHFFIQNPGLLASGCIYYTVVLQNEGNNQFTLQILNSFTSHEAHAVFLDFNNDGFLDFYSNDAFYENEQNGSFIKKDFNVAVPPFGIDPVIADLDQDGQIEFFSGKTGYEYKYGVFSICERFSGIVLATGDYDKDGDQDVLTMDGVMENIDGVFTLFPGFSYDPIPVCDGCYKIGKFADFNQDGFLDILIRGYTNQGSNMMIYTFENGVFSKVIDDLPNLGQEPFGSNIEWIDLNNDGYLDIVSSGATTAVLMNHMNQYYYSDSSFTHTYKTQGRIQCADFDNDGDLDFSIGHMNGANGSDYPIFFYRNNTITPNSPPDLPTCPIAVDSLNSVTLSWTAPPDDHTPSPAITYNIFILRENNTVLVVSPLSNIQTGFRFIPTPGNVKNTNSIKIFQLINGSYSWGVQAIDNAYQASGFTEQQQFTITGNNLPPEINSFGKVTTLNDSLFFSDTDFLSNFMDPESDSLAAIKIVRLPTFGNLLINAVPVLENQVIPTANLHDLSYVTTSLHKDTIQWIASDGNSYAVDTGFISIESVIFKEYHSFEITNDVLKRITCGDINNDGFTDLVVDNSLYLNSNGSFVEANPGLNGNGTNLVVADIDNDLDLDILDGTTCFRNEQLVFTPFTPFGSLNCTRILSIPTDFNNDGWIDVLLLGQLNDGQGTLITRLYKNNNSLFQEVCPDVFPGLYLSNAAWADFNNDGWNDFILMGATTFQASGETGITYLCLNNGDETFQCQVIDGFCNGDIDWADVDTDGDFDALIIGRKNFWASQSVCLMNDTNHVISYSGGPFSLRDGGVKWLNIDNNETLEAVLSGYSDYIWNNDERNYSGVYTLEEDAFSLLPGGLTHMAFGQVLFFDYNNDGYSDICTSGIDRTANSEVILYRNTYGIDACLLPNTPPTAPGNLQSTVDGQHVSFSWNPSVDLQTPANGLTYNLFATRSDGSLAISPLSDMQTGYRRINSNGNASYNHFWHLDSLPPGTYNWSVQAIDNSFAGGPFATEQSFTIFPQVPPVLAIGTDSAADGESKCYDASQTITAGGNGESFRVSAGGAATLIAGHNIVLLPSVQVEAGAYFHGYITTTNEYCAAVMPPGGAMPLGVTRNLAPGNKEALLSVYPNPTTGTVHLVVRSTDTELPVSIRLYDMFGEQVYAQVLLRKNKEDISLTAMRPGLYLLHVAQGGRSDVVKVIKQ